MVRAPARDEHGRQHDVERDGGHLHHHPRLDDARAAQHRAGHRQHELQREAGQRPADEGDAGLRDGGVGRHAAHVGRRGRDAQHQRGRHARQPEQHRLLEHAAGARLVAGAQGVGHQRDGAHAQHLRQRDHQQRDVARGGDAGDRLLAESRHEPEVDHQVQRLHQHADGDGQRHGHEMAADGALGEVTHPGAPGRRPRPASAARAAGAATGGRAPGACEARAAGPAPRRPAIAAACGTRCNRPCASSAGG